MQNFLGENDGFVGEWGVNNFYLYRLENKPQHGIIAWDDDLTFLDSGVDLRRVELPGIERAREQTDGVAGVSRPVLRDAERGREIGERGHGAGRARRAGDRDSRRELDLIDGAMLADTQRPYSDTEYLDAREFMKQFAARRARYVECEVARLTGTRPCA